MRFKYSSTIRVPDEVRIRKASNEANIIFTGKILLWSGSNENQKYLFSSVRNAIKPLETVTPNPATNKNITKKSKNAVNNLLRRGSPSLPIHK